LVIAKFYWTIFTIKLLFKEMEEKLKSEGKCLYCGETFSSMSISKHLGKHLKEIALKPAATATAYHLLVKNGPYFLHLLVDGQDTLSNLDLFLRRIWLECCGHMSAFTHKGSYDEIKMTQKISKIFDNYSELKYEYDFGSTTQLALKLYQKYPIQGKDEIILLSRNEPLAIMCDTCKKEPATKLCTVHDWDEDSAFCDDCAENHEEECSDFADYSAMPVVNSPRIGVCAYDGGSIDTERDGVFQKK
jgi:hypothetical protein